MLLHSRISISVSLSKEIFFFYIITMFNFLWRRESKKETSTLPKAPPYMEGMQPLLLSLRH